MEKRDSLGAINIKAIEIEAELKQIKTRVDGSVDIVLNCPEYVMPQVKVMLDWLNDMVHCIIELGPNK